MNCKYCNKEFHRTYPSDTQTFCSRKCVTQWQSKNLKGLNSPKNKRIVKSCEYCGKEFIARGHRIKEGRGKFCSSRCWGIQARVNMRKGNKETDIEKKLREGMEIEGMEFEREKPIGRIAVVDFLIKGKLIVQADGDYWHSLPKMIEKDHRQDKILKEMGYVILRFLGSKIKEDVNGCIKEIRDTVNTTTG